MVCLILARKPMIYQSKENQTEKCRQDKCKRIWLSKDACYRMQKYIPNKVQKRSDTTKGYDKN